MDRKKVIIITSVAVIITNIFTVLLTGFGSEIVGLMSSSFVNAEGVSFQNIEKYNKVKDLLKTRYVDNVDDNKLMEGAIRGLADSLDDPYTVYMDKKEFESLEAYTKANYAGIGVVVGIDPKDNLIMISEVFEGSPAQKAQIIAGDKIIKVNDKEVTGDNFESAVNMIRGEKGSKVNLTVIRVIDSSPQELTISVPRDEIEITTVKTNQLLNDIGYIRILQFAEKTSVEFKNAVSELKNKGAKKLVIDVRDNPGGLLDQVVSICGQLLPRGLVVYTVDKNGKREDFYSQGGDLDIPFVVLINERSASASEILAGAVKDYKKAQLIGTKTYGKGVVQSVFELNDGSGIKVTTSKYYTPSGATINKVGVQPDVVVDLNDKHKAISSLTIDQDNQLKKAIEVLNTQ